jgi:hypothetical protein
MGVDVGHGLTINYKADQHGHVHTDNPEHAAALATVGGKVVEGTATRRAHLPNTKDATKTWVCESGLFEAWMFSSKCPRCGDPRP